MTWGHLQKDRAVSCLLGCHIWLAAMWTKHPMGLSSCCCARLACVGYGIPAARGIPPGHDGITDELADYAPLAHDDPEEDRTMARKHKRCHPKSQVSASLVVAGLTCFWIALLPISRCIGAGGVGNHLEKGASTGSWSPKSPT